MTGGSAVPVTVVGGYLGAGKTTLINKVLANPHGLRVAVLVNDFGSVDIDSSLIESSDGDTISLANGCVCCSLADGLAMTMLDLSEAQGSFDHVLIEVSGVGDPWKVAQWGRSPGFELDAVVVLAAADAIVEQSTDKYIGETVVSQLRAADVAVLTRSDLVSDQQVKDTVDWMISVGSAPVSVAHSEELPTELLFGPGRARSRSLQDADPGAASHAAHATWTIATEAPVTIDAVESWLNEMPADLWRVKGYIECIDRTPSVCLVQVVGKRTEVVSASGSASPNVLVVIASPGANSAAAQDWVDCSPWSTA